MIGIDLKIEEAALREVMNNADQKSFFAMADAVKKTSRWLSRQIATAIARETLLPKKALQPRIFTRINQKQLTGLLWIGLNPISPRHAGKLTQEEWGVSAGEYFFKGAFIARAHNSPDLIWRRVGSSRFPIKREFIEIEDTSLRVIQRFERQAQHFFLKRLREALHYRLNLRK